MNGLIDDMARTRHEERIARSLHRYDLRLRRDWSIRRLKPDTCPLTALAQWLAARLRPATPVSQ